MHVYVYIHLCDTQFMRKLDQTQIMNKFNLTSSKGRHSKSNKGCKIARHFRPYIQSQKEERARCARTQGCSKRHHLRRTYLLRPVRHAWMMRAHTHTHTHTHTQRERERERERERDTHTYTHTYTHTISLSLTHTHTHTCNRRVVPAAGAKSQVIM